MAETYSITEKKKEMFELAIAGLVKRPTIKETLSAITSECVIALLTPGNTCLLFPSC